MKINMVKQYGGVLVPSSDLDSEKLIKFKTGETYEIDIKLSRCPAFHRKVFAFLNFCFQHWQCEIISNEQVQFDRMREELTIYGGYYHKVYNLKGELRLVAKSISYSNMPQEEFEDFYLCLTNAAMQTIFKGADNETYNKLISFFN